MTRRYIPLIILASVVLSAKGQYNPKIDVEGTYKPDIIDLDRINQFPELPKLSVVPSALQFDLRETIANFTPEGIPMEATGWGITAPSRKGFIHAEAGSWLDARLAGGCRLLDSPTTMAAIWLDHNSTSLWKPFPDLQGIDLKRKIYNEKIGLCMTHKMADYGTLSASLKYNYAYFNYYGYPSEDLSQSLNDAALSLIWRADRSRSLRIDAGADVRYTGFRSLYLPPFTLPVDGVSGTYDLQRIGGGRNTAIGLGLDISKSFNGMNNRLGIKLKGDIILTGGMDGGSRYLTYTPENHGLFTIKPYYLYSKGNLKFISGVRMDLPVNTKSPDARLKEYNYIFPKPTEGKNFYISPDVRLGYFGRQVSLDVRIAGGASLYTLAEARQLDFYCQPGIWNTLPEYSPLDAFAAVRFGPFGGFQLKISGAYRILHGQRTGGWYTTLLNGGITNLYKSSAPSIMALADRTVDVSGASVGVALAYEYGPEFRISAEANWQPQHDKTCFFNGYDLPEITACVNVESNPWSSLKLGLRYDLRALRHPLAYDYALIDAEAPLINVGIDNWSDLSFRASYDIGSNLTLGVKVGNLLNRQQMLLPGLPVPGVTALGSLTWSF